MELSHVIVTTDTCDIYSTSNRSHGPAYGAPGDFRQGDRQFFSYSARGPGERDDGTLAPTAALGSMCFAPEIVAPAARAMHARYGRGIYGRYGFWDSFNRIFK